MAGDRLKYHLVICAIALLCISHAAIAQSGRHPKKREPLPPLPTEPKPDPALDEPSRVVAVNSILVSGDVLHDSKFYRSNDLALATKACVNRLREGLGIEITKGGKLKQKEAIEWAKKETATYLLWLEIKMRTGIYGDGTVSHINYYLFVPQTAQVMLKGQYDPYEQVPRINGARVPGVTGPKYAILQLEDGGRQIADRVIRQLQ